MCVNQTPSAKIDITVAVIAFNEEAIIYSCLEILFSSLKEIPLSFELMVINNGSGDHTLEEINRWKKLNMTANFIDNIEFRLIELPENKGLCGGTIEAIRQAQGRWIMPYSADMQFKVDDVMRYINGANLLSTADDTTIGAVVGIRSSRPGYTLLQRRLSEFYHRTIGMLTGLQLEDFGWNCLYQTAVVKTLQIRSQSIFFLPEILCRLNRIGYKLVPVPSPVHDRPNRRPTISQPIVWIKAISDMLRYLVFR